MLSEYPRVVVGVNSFVALVLQAVPFVLVGGVISAMVAVFIPSYVWVRWLPKNKYCAVVVAAGYGIRCATGCCCDDDACGSVAESVGDGCNYDGIWWLVVGIDSNDCKCGGGDRCGIMYYVVG